MNARLASVLGADGKLASFTSLGCYPLFYVTKDHQVVCPACANKPHVNADQAPVDVDANWEDASLFCDDCGDRIPSAYAEPEDDDAT